ncbi:hypothetical protein QBC38DRAFT_504888 [Podospora fimiseda]|uniref:Heterokaryon incompatibility domain-containing protein n=1 Tax=Podospora fimiseda TaxID=252190 RepID=A0AAN7BEX0_9PEZI|nr:hypothetical protein QBC38DRAFT_504888 [Podospora fimiseda]
MPQQDEVIEHPTTRDDSAPDLTSEQIAFVRDALRTCLSHLLHRCDPKLNLGLPEQWPKRILDNTEVITLIDFDSQKLPGQYDALSYCWSERDELERHPSLKATSTALSDLKSGIAHSKVTSHSSTSSQNSKDGLDWETEAVKMKTVYSMAKVVIIASSSTSCHSGFFDTKVPESLELMDGQVQLRRSSYAGFHADVNWHQDLAPAARKWEGTLRTFPRTVFTVETDKLLAISGLARMIEPQFGSVHYDTIYLAGLWLRMARDTTTEPLRTNINTDSLAQLLWGFGQPSTGQPSHTYVAPSFSWASINRDRSFSSVGLFHLPNSLSRILSVTKQLMNTAGL